MLRAVAVIARAGACLVVACLVGCAGGVATRGARTAVRSEGATLSPEEAFGAQVEVTDARRALYGELVGCDERGIFLALNERGAGRWQRVAWREVRELRVRRAGVGVGGWAWVLIGVVSSSLHGIYALASAPSWGALGVGIAAPGFTPSRAVPVANCEAVRAYARFPQGVPRAMWPRFGARASALAPWEIDPSPETLAPE